jgi:hypothetical protein
MFRLRASAAPNLQFKLIAATCTTTGSEGNDFDGCAAKTAESVNELMPKSLQAHRAKAPAIRSDAHPTMGREPREDGSPMRTHRMRREHVEHRTLIERIQDSLESPHPFPQERQPLRSTLRHSLSWMPQDLESMFH